MEIKEYDMDGKQLIKLMAYLESQENLSDLNDPKSRKRKVTLVKIGEIDTSIDPKDSYLSSCHKFKDVVLVFHDKKSKNKDYSRIEEILNE